MGTAGSVKLAEDLIGDDEDFIVYYGDNLTNLDFDRLLAFHREKKALATVCMRPLPEGYRSTSVITLEADNRVKVFLEKPPLEELQKYEKEKRYINNGIYVLRKEVFRYIPAGRKYDFAKELFPHIMKQDLGLFGYPTEEYFREIGRIEKYKSFLEEVRGLSNIFEKRKAVFLDRDGVINANVNRLAKPEDFVMLPGVPEAIRRLNEAGYKVIMLTNQPDIAKGFVTFSEIGAIHDKMRGLLAKEGAHIDAVYICPHHPDKGFPGELPELKIDCDCRKPKPGLVLRAARENNIDLSSSWLVGDSNSDIAAGKAAGVRTILSSFGGGSGAKHERSISAKPEVVRQDLVEAVDFILHHK
jgi:histidinol-phosphate phosphatase family protein